MKEKYIFGLLGLAIGGVLGYYFGYLRRRKELEDILQNEHRWYRDRIKELDEKYNENLREMGFTVFEKEPRIQKPKKSQEEKSEKVDLDDKKRTLIHHFSEGEPPRKSLTQERRERIIREHDLAEMDKDIAEAYEHPEDDEPDEEDIEEYRARQESYEPGGWRRPYIISEEEFMEEHEHDFDKINVYFWGECGTYSEEGSGMPVEDPRDVFGDETCQMALEMYEDREFNEELFVRNEGLSIDYCIEVKDSSYKRGVLGMED